MVLVEKKKRVVQRGGNYVLLGSKNMHVFARGGCNFEWFWWKKKRVVQRGGNDVLLVKMCQLRAGLRHDSCMYLLICFALTNHLFLKN